ncbi:phosphatase PAP2 family protein [Methylobacterium sp. J-076]|uniref:phosphatase PAP2 family protein n=1 Tax=Methylobacterium sp. J-076 TaxID=2836655 RepID=UPI001FBB18E6|nr:phosphatase PAP2 family protein [Methylobacterium sp. J-076]
MSPRLGVWGLILAVATGTVLWMGAAGLRFDWPSAAVTFGTCLLLEALAFTYRTLRPEPRIAATLGGLVQVIAFGACAAPLSYAVASTAGPLWDTTFAGWDRSLGLDWRAYLAFVDAHPRLGFAMTVAYRSLMVQMMLVIVLLGFCGRLTALRQFVLAFCLSGTVTVLMSGLTPAMANFVHLQLGPADFPHLRPAAAFAHVSHLTGLRDGTLRTVSLDAIEGIITFPSFHATSGALFLWAFWALPAARLPALVLNVLLVASTPIDGGHYFVDVAAGLLVAGLAILAARRFTPRPAQAAPPASVPERGAGVAALGAAR